MILLWEKHVSINSNWKLRILRDFVSQIHTQVTFQSPLQSNHRMFAPQSRHNWYISLQSCQHNTPAKKVFLCKSFWKTKGVIILTPKFTTILAGFEFLHSFGCYAGRIPLNGTCAASEVANPFRSAWHAAPNPIPPNDANFGRTI